MCCSTGVEALTVTWAVALAEPPRPEAVIVEAVVSEGVTLVEPWAVTAPTSGAMESCVASVEFQLKVADSPLLTEVGLACSVTVGLAAGGGGSVVLGVGATVFLPQPKVKTAAARATSKLAR